MPCAGTHVVFADKAFEMMKNEKMLHVSINKNSLYTYANGFDLIALDRKLNDLCHNQCVQKYEYTLTDYIIQNKLYESAEVMAYAYGHIMHIILDQMIHPFVTANSHSFKEHILLEEKIDQVTFFEHFKVCLNDIKLTDYCYNISLTADVKEMIDHISYYVYGYPNVDIEYTEGIKTLKKLEDKFRFDLKGKKKKIYSLIGLDYVSHYMDIEECKKEMNEQYGSWRYSNRHDSIYDTMFMALNKYFYVCNYINKCIYQEGRVDIDYMKIFFPDTSLDTGNECVYQKTKNIAFNK